MAATAQTSSGGSRMKLINATIALLASKGYESTGIHEILETAKVSKSNFYYHFKSKEELCLAALDKIAQIFFATVLNQTLGNAGLTPIRRLERHFEYLTEVMETQSCDGGCVFTNLEAETSDFYPSFREKLHSIDRETLAAIERTLQEGVASGEFRALADVQNTALMILGIYKGCAVVAKTQKSADAVQRASRALFELIVP